MTSRAKLITLIALFGVGIAALVYAAATAGTASVDTHWVASGSSNTLSFTVNNPSGATDYLWVQIVQPNDQLTITDASAAGWSASVTGNGQSVLLTGGSISGDSSSTISVTVTAGTTTTAQAAWTVKVSDKANGSLVQTQSATGEGLNTGIDATAPTNQAISSITVDSASQLTALAATGSDAESGLSSTPYFFTESSGNAGGSSSTDYQTSTSFSDSGLSPNTQYTYTVKLKDTSGNESTNSATSSKYTLANTPTTGSFGTVTETSIVADWAANSNPAGTEYYAENQTASANSGWITDTTWTSASLTAEEEYTFRVKARNTDSTDTAWVSLGSKSTSTSSSSEDSDSSSSSYSDSSSSDTATTTTTATPTPTPAIPQATGPTVAAPVVAPEPAAAEIGAPGTTTSDTSAGETTTEVPILPSAGDTTPPTVTFTSPPEVVDETKVTLAGEAIETKGEFSGVIASLAYSFDGGISWHPVSSAEGLGTEEATFTVTTPPLPDGTYDIIVRARDNTDNEGLSETTQATIDLLPVIFGSAVLLQSSGDAFPTANPTTVAGTPLQLIAAFAGGVTKAQVNLEEQVVPLTPDSIKRRFSGTITLDQPGSYPLLLEANDGAGNSFERTIGTVTIVPALQVLDHKTGEPLAGAQVTLEKFDPEAKVWRLNKTPGQENPQITTEEGSVILLADRGIHRLRIKAPKHWNGVTHRLTLSEPSTLTGTIRLPRRQWYKYLIPLRTRPLPLTAENAVIVSPPTTTDETRTLELTARDTTDVKRTLEEFRGHRVLLTTVAAWNRTSHEQLAILQRLQDALGKDVTIIPWLVQQPGSVLSGILQRGHYNLIGFADNTGQDTETLGRTIFPTHFLFDRSGNLRKTRTGFATVDELIELLRDVQ